MHFSKKFFEGAPVCACGSPGEIVAHDMIGEGDARDLQLLAIFCGNCAADGISKLPVCRWLQIIALSRPDLNRGVKVRRKYKVHFLNERSNRATIVIIDGSNKFLSGLTSTIRHDVLAPDSRILDAEFGLSGTPLEIELFEHSASQD